MDEHVGLAVRHASGGGSSRIRLLRGIRRIGGGLCRTVSRGFRLGRDTRSSDCCGLGGIGGLIGRIRQSLRIASRLLSALGGGLRGIGGILGLTGGRGGTLRGSGSRIGGILRCLGRTIGRISRALRVFRCGSRILSGLLRVGGLRGIIRDIRLCLLDLLRIVLHVGITHAVPLGAVPHERVDHAVGQRHEHGRRIIRSPEPVRVKVREHGRRIVLLALPASPILLRLEPQVADDQIVLRHVRPTEGMVLRVGFGIRLRRRLLRLRYLAVRRGQVAFGLRDVLPGLRQIGLGLRERLVRRVEIRLVGLDVLPRLIELGRIVLQSRLVVSQILLDSFDLFRRDRRSDRHRGDGRPAGPVARMVDRPQRIGVPGTGCQTGHKIIAPTGLGGADDGHAVRIDALADLDMVEVRFHLSASACPAIPMDGHHAKLRRQYRLRRHGTRRRIRLHSCHDDARPFAELVRICWHSPDAHLDLRAAIQAAETELRLIGRAGGMPGRTVHVPAPFDAVRRYLDGRVVRGLRDRAPHGGRQTIGVPVGPDVGVGLHHQTSRSIRHTMVLLGGGTPALAAGQLRAAGDAGDLLRGPHLRVVYLVVEGNRGLESVGVEADGDLLDSHLLAVLDGGRGDPVAGPVVHQRQ